MKVKVVGFNSFTSQKGNQCNVLMIEKPFSESQMRNGAVGLQVEAMFIGADLAREFNPAWVGKDCELTYEVVGNRAYPAGIKPC